MNKDYLNGVLSMIDVAISRGAIRGEDIYAVAQLRRTTEDLMKEPEKDPKELIQEALRSNQQMKDEVTPKPSADTNRVTKKNDSA